MIKVILIVPCLAIPSMKSILERYDSVKQEINNLQCMSALETQVIKKIMIYLINFKNCDPFII